MLPCPSHIFTQVKNHRGGPICGRRGGGAPNRAPKSKILVASKKGWSAMSRMTQLSSPLLLGFDDIERLLDRLAKSPGDSYPPYNIERIAAASNGLTRASGTTGDILRITLAVAGFTREQIDIAVEDRQLTIRGRQDDDKSRTYLHRGIAARQFQRTFVLADGIEVRSASLDNGLLSIDLVRPEPERLVRKIEIRDSG